MFGYGSLTALADGVVPSRTPRAEGFVCDLHGYRRQWGVAMDNRRDLPGYKHYTDEPAGGRRCSSASSTSRPTRAARSTGCASRSTARGSRSSTSASATTSGSTSRRSVDAGGARVWAYVGGRDARLRMRWAVGAHRAVIDAPLSGHGRRRLPGAGRASSSALRASLSPGRLPVVALTRHDHCRAASVADVGQAGRDHLVDALQVAERARDRLAAGAAVQLEPDLDVAGRMPARSLDPLGADPLDRESQVRAAREHITEHAAPSS